LQPELRSTQTFFLTLHIHDIHLNLNICILFYQGIAVCDLPGDTMLPGEM